jgi:muconolactone delta-isomerase
MKQYMVDFTLPNELNDDFVNQIPTQRAKVNRFFVEGKLLSYVLALENGKLWAVFQADDESELLDLVYELPLTSQMRLCYHELTFYNAAHSYAPVFSMN